MIIKAIQEGIEVTNTNQGQVMITVKDADGVEWPVSFTPGAALKIASQVYIAALRAQAQQDVDSDSCDCFGGCVDG